MLRLPRALESNSIQITIAVSYALLVIFTVLFLGTTALVLTRDALWDTTTYYSEQLVEQVRTGIGNYLGEMDGIATVLLEEDALRDLVLDPGRDDLREDVRRIFSTVARMRPDISLLALAGPAIDPLFHDAEFARNPAVDPSEQGWYREAVSAGGRAVYSDARVQNLVRDRYRWVVSLARARGEAVLLVDLNFRVIERLARSVRMGPRGYLFITDAEGSIIYHPQQQLIYSDLVAEPIERLLEPGVSPLVYDTGEEQRLYIVDSVGRTGWRVVAVNPVDQLLASQRQLQSYYLSWVALCFAIVMVLTVVLSRRISGPIMRLRRSIQAVEQGRFDIDLHIERRDEIGALSRDFEIMLSTVRELMARNRHEQEEKRRSEIKALQNQITPHFLYNTLDSIVWMAESGRVDEVVEMTTNLGRLLRLGIGRGEAMVSLGTELEHLKSYLRIQEMRYRDRLQFRIEAEEATLPCRLPRLSLQPVVENAIYHGIKNRPGGGTIAVRTVARDRFVEIAVEDDGPGIDPAVLDRLRRHRVEPSNGVGLKNVHQRLALTFGEDYRISFDSVNGAGTVVTIRIPWEDG
ncbi:MAG: sensor histidine kinase [Spirochaetales bacterium]|nr:sensor histidine kinase [Spirochaetales bacterium]